MKRPVRLIIVITCCILLYPSLLWAGETNELHQEVAAAILWWPIMLIVAKLMAALMQKIKQPPVLGELLAGVILGNLTLIGTSALEPIRQSNFIYFIAEVGVVLLLFRVGLESTVQGMVRVGLPSLLVALIGVVTPFLLGWLLGPYLFPGLSSNVYIFLGATLTATSVGITARVFTDLNKLKTREAQVVLGAAVIDDVIGLIILAVVVAIVETGNVSSGDLAWITTKSILFVVGSIGLGLLVAPITGRFLARIHPGIGMKVVFAFSLMALFAFLANAIGLALIVGGFAAGLVLDHVHFKPFDRPKHVAALYRLAEGLPAMQRKAIHAELDHQSEKHIEDYIEDIGHVFVPVFFVLTGINVRLETLFDANTLLLGLVLTAIAVIGKLLSGFGAWGNMKRLIIGVGMVPRGEVGLIFAAIGARLGVLNDATYSIIVIMVMLTTLLPPPFLAYLAKRLN